MSTSPNPTTSGASAGPIIAFETLRPSNERLQEEMSSLQKEMKKVETEIYAVKNTLLGLEVIYGEEVFSPEALNQIHAKRTTTVRGLTTACRIVLIRARVPCSVTTVCHLISALDPGLLVHHRNQRASVMTVLRNFAKRGQVIRGSRDGRSVWEWAGEKVSGGN